MTPPRTHETSSLPSALLLLGPTGSGKTPLGELLERRGWRGRRCAHFDFGARLRMVVDPDRPWQAGLAPSESSVVRDCLERGALLENETFGIASRILSAFVTERLDDPDGLLIMNGLPRHVDQAKMLAAHVDVTMVLALECDAETILERIRLDTGGDRASRNDDEVDAVRRRLKIYDERTTPLVDHYLEGEADLIRLPVGVHTSAEDLLDSVPS